MTSSRHDPYGLGHIRATMEDTKGSKCESRSQSTKVFLTMDCSLKFDYMKLESLVIVDKTCNGELVYWLCTHRPSYSESEWFLKSLCL